MAYMRDAKDTDKINRFLLLRKLTKMISFQASKLCSIRVIKSHLPTFPRLFTSLPPKLYSTGNEKIAVSTPDEKLERPSTIPQYHLSRVDKLTLKWFGNVKGEIPNEVSYATMEKAESKRRIAVNLCLVALCVFGSMFVIYNVKKNLLNQSEDNIYVQNRKRYQQDSNEKS